MCVTAINFVTIEQEFLINKHKGFAGEKGFMECTIYTVSISHPYGDIWRQLKAKVR